MAKILLYNDINTQLMVGVETKGDDLNILKYINEKGQTKTRFKIKDDNECISCWIINENATPMDYIRFLNSMEKCNQSDKGWKSYTFHVNLEQSHFLQRAMWEVKGSKWKVELY